MLQSFIVYILYMCTVIKYPQYPGHFTHFPILLIQHPAANTPFRILLPLFAHHNLTLLSFLSAPAYHHLRPQVRGF